MAALTASSVDTLEAGSAATSDATVAACAMEMLVDCAISAALAMAPSLSVAKSWNWASMEALNDDDMVRAITTPARQKMSDAIVATHMRCPNGKGTDM